MVLLLYRLLFPFAFLVALPFYARKMLRRERGRAAQAKPQGYHLGLAERFGRYDAALKARLDERPVSTWICSISVGEVLLALKLARAVRARDPEARVVLSVTTSTGYELLLREASSMPWLVPIYNPIDFAFAARAAISAIRPAVLVLTEGGVWPNLLAAARSAGVRIVLASARLSPRSERRWRRFPAVARAVWSAFDLVCVPEEADIARFAGIGVSESRIRHTGSVKLDVGATQAPSREAEFRALVAPAGFSGPVLVGGSTWAPEEKVLAEALLELRREFNGLRLIIVPRHVERSAAIERELSEAGLRVTRRSRFPASAEADVLLVDATGELRDWYRLATVAFVGKSLPGVAEVGGQNAGEPAALGVPVIFGPHMENFAPLVAHLLKLEAAIQVGDASALAPALRSMLADPAKRTAIGRRGAEALAVHQGAAARTVELLFS
jgi:3-deoxy-D-manno-octulosonic-acid transferase